MNLILFMKYPDTIIEDQTFMLHCPAALFVRFYTQCANTLRNIFLSLKKRRSLSLFLEYLQFVGTRKLFAPSLNAATPHLGRDGLLT
ncbi:hypothetical protein [Enterovibrio paralichthyis]|uniref:hypothetical protein n=1 Tax=Enterovibrio paralichthyis TaxID=2853805 RepID=UPI001C4931D7|nr:hypothetical protein [Enterovibrio paralichthyis]MBV7296430.1 hypothetical protein [Enterovibrio paralichthyis]